VIHRTGPSRETGAIEGGIDDSTSDSANAPRTEA
jgi:hypothetical protein